MNLIDWLIELLGGHTQKEFSEEQKHLRSLLSIKVEEANTLSELLSKCRLAKTQPKEKDMGNREWSNLIGVCIVNGSPSGYEIVRTSDGRLLHRFSTINLDEAIEEAKKLATEEIGEEFCVVGVLRKYKADVPIKETVTKNGAA